MNQQNDIITSIQNKLTELENRHGVRILCAVESGSRSWGFPSATSDYDVRVVYYRPMDDYLRVQLHRDTIEWELNEVYDITGWDLRKALGLALKSNVSLSEWVHSPIVYRSAPMFDEFRKIVHGVADPVRLARHYVGVAVSTINRYLCRAEVPYKQYFYALRPLLAARWVLERREPAPILFSTLRQALLPADMDEEVDTLLRLRSGGEEKASGPARPVADAFVRCELASLTAALDTATPAPKAEADISRLDAFFRQTIRGFQRSMPGI